MSSKTHEIWNAYSHLTSPAQLHVLTLQLIALLELSTVDLLMTELKPSEVGGRRRSSIGYQDAEKTGLQMSA